MSVRERVMQCGSVNTWGPVSNSSPVMPTFVSERTSHAVWECEHLRSRQQQLYPSVSARERVNMIKPECEHLTSHQQQLSRLAHLCQWENESCDVGTWTPEIPSATAMPTCISERTSMLESLSVNMSLRSYQQQLSGRACLCQSVHKRVTECGSVHAWGPLFKAWSRSFYSHACYAYCQGFLPCLFLPFRSIHLHFFQNLSRFLLCWLWLTHGSWVGPHNKTGHPAGCRSPSWVPAEYK